MVHHLLIDRGDYEKYLIDNMEQFDIVSIKRRDLALLDANQLHILHEVCKDRKTYNLAKSHLGFNPKLWDDMSLKVWINFVSKKYVDNNKVDISKGESPELEEELRNYWRLQEHMWAQASEIYETLKTLSHHRETYEKILRLARSMRLSTPYPPWWTEEDNIKFLDWFRSDFVTYSMTSSMTSDYFFDSKVKKWTETLHEIQNHYGIDLENPKSMEEEDEGVIEIASEEMSPSSIGIADSILPSPPPESYSSVQEVHSFYPVSQPIRYSPDFGDPEDWDRDLLNRWLQFEFARYGVDLNPYSMLERQRRLVMIYVRCAWPCDNNEYSLSGICKIFSKNFGTLIHNDILSMRPATRVPEIVSKPDSQRHRNRRDLHLWEFLLILLANAECERESIHWKDDSRGIFELANRHRVATLWGLTKGNGKMTYDNMSRSVRQYYKDDNAGIMIRHQPGTQSLGKYSYQFSMMNNEVHKLWNSLLGPPDGDLPCHNNGANLKKLNSLSSLQLKY